MLGLNIFRQITYSLSAVLALAIALAPLGSSASANAGTTNLAITNIATGSANVSASAAACPFCSAIALTFTEQLGSNEIAVVAKLVELPPPPQEDEDGYLEFPKGKFEIVGVLKGEKIVNVGMNFKTQLVGTHPVGQKFLIMGVNPPRVSWTTPMRTTDRVEAYLKDIQKLPPGGADRLVFFQDYFEDEEQMLAFDAYDEYAKAPYEDLLAMKDRMDHDKLMRFIKDPETTFNRRRLYLTMLGVCGNKEDAKILEGYLKSGDRKQQGGLDALIACYLTLQGAEGVPLIEDLFLKDMEVNYVDVVATVMALRFHATESDVIPQKRIIEAVRNLLDRPKLADMVIADLARWKDWSVMERLVKMFKDADEDSNWLRTPVITYLRACPDPKAAKYIEELRKIDPQAVERADFYLDFGDDEDDDEFEDATESKSDDSKAVESKKDSDKADSDKAKADGGKDKKATDTDGGKSSSKLQAEKDVANLPVALPMSEERVSVAQGDPIVIQPAATSDVSQISVPVESGTTYVSTAAPTGPDLTSSVGEIPSEDAIAAISDSENEQVARSSVVESAVSKDEPNASNITLKIIFIPFLGSLVILVTMWSVVNGWFERLIY